MDEDLFDFDQDIFDEECINQARNELIEQDEDQKDQQTDPTYIFSLLLNCCGAATNEENDRLFRKDLEAELAHLKYSIPSEVEMFNFEFSENLPLDVLIQMARKNIQKLALSMIDSYESRVNSFFITRECVTKLMLIIRCNFEDLSTDQLKIIRVALGTFDSMPNFSQIHAAHCQDGNSSNSATFHLLHGQLEWRWIFLTLMYKLDFSRGLLGSDESEFKTELTLLIYDMLTLSISKIHKCNIASLAFSSPFICSCVKTIWSLVKQICDDSSISFWDIFSNILSEMKQNKNPYAQFPSKIILLRTSSHITCKSIDQFSIWLVCGLVKVLDGSENQKRESYALFESLEKSYLSSEQSEESLRVFLLIISDVIFEVWSPKPDVLMLLWEGFHRKINSPFYSAGQTPNVMAVAPVSGASYLEKIRTQQSANTKLNPNSTSFDMFVHLIGKMVQKSTDDGQKVQVQKVLGRIYITFPATKLATLNEMGIHNLLKLFLTLCVSTNFPEIAKKVSETLLQIPIEKVNHQQQLLKGHMAMLLLHRENQMNISYYVTKLMTQVNQLSERSNSVSAVLKIIADALPKIILTDSSEEMFANGEELLLDSWIVKYLTLGTSAEQDRVYESLTKIIKKICEAKSSALESSNLNAIVKNLFSFLMPHCKQNFGKNDTTWMPTMVGQLCILSASYDHLKQHEIPQFDVLFKIFIDLNYSNIENSINFFVVLLENQDKIKKLDQLAIMQHWIKCSVLLSGNNETLKKLTRCLLKFNEFTSICETARCQPEDFLSAKEPLCTFITDIGNKYSAANNQVKLQLIEKMHSYFCTFEKWALPLLQQQQQQVSRNQSTSSNDEVMRIFMFISLTILHCSELIYVRSKSQCFFNVAMSHFILPPALMMGQTQPKSIIISIYKVWPLLIDGIARLDYKNDPHIAKVLNDVIVKWAPLLKISTNTKVVAKPFINMTNSKNSDIVELVYGKLTKSYVALQNRKPSPHASMLLTMIEEVMHVIEADETKLMLIWKNSMLHVIEAAMISDDNVICCNLLERFIKNRNFETSQTMKELLIKSLQSVMQANLSYHSGFCFRFLLKFAGISPKVINSQMAFILAQIKKCEQMRGSGADMKLRGMYEQLQTKLNKK